MKSSLLLATALVITSARPALAADEVPERNPFKVAAESATKGTGGAIGALDPQLAAPFTGAKAGSPNGPRLTSSSSIPVARDLIDRVGGFHPDVEARAKQAYHAQWGGKIPPSDSRLTQSALYTQSAAAEARAMIIDAKKVVNTLNLEQIRAALAAHTPGVNGLKIETVEQARQILIVNLDAIADKIELERLAAASNTRYKPDWKKILLDGGRPGFATVAAILDSSPSVQAGPALTRGLRALNLKGIPIASLTGKIHGYVTSGRFLTGVVLAAFIAKGANAADASAAKDAEGALGVTSETVTSATVDDFQSRSASQPSTQKTNVSQ